MSHSAAAAISTTTVLVLPIDGLQIGLDFRLDEDTDALAELAMSITEHGILQPLVVRQIDGAWEVVAGRRRLAAARIAGLSDVPCVLRSLTDDEAADIALVENVHRRDLSTIEEALAFARLRDQGLTQTQIAQRVGRSQTHVSMLLRCLELPQEMQEKIHRRQISYATALDMWGRKRFRQTGTLGPGGAHADPALTGQTAEMVSHWRRRHDRLLSGLQRIRRAKADGISLAGVITMIERLIELDHTALPPESEAKQ